MVHVVTDQTAIDAARPADAGTAILSGIEVLPSPLLAALLRNGAKLRPLCRPDAESEPAYRPSQNSPDTSGLGI